MWNFPKSKIVVFHHNSGNILALLKIPLSWLWNRSKTTVVVMYHNSGNEFEFLNIQVNNFNWPIKISIWPKISNLVGNFQKKFPISVIYKNCLFNRDSNFRCWVPHALSNWSNSKILPLNSDFLSAFELFPLHKKK